VRYPGRELGALLGPVIPGDDASQTLADSFIARALGRSEGSPWRVLDLGCGTGSSLDAFRARDPAVEWTGLDLLDSPEARERTRTDAPFATFDGIKIPFEDGAFDLVYCKQVLEHVRHPEPLLAEARRVIAPGGFFAGSTSQLEPFHSYSYWGYTPFGFCELLRTAHLDPVEIRPGIDALTLLARRGLGQRGLMERRWQRWWASESPLNRVIDRYGRARGLPVEATAANKLLFAGQFAFLARHGA
jgi:SAM-dependent methyltransferase